LEGLQLHISKFFSPRFRTSSQTNCTQVSVKETKKIVKNLEGKEIMYSPENLSIVNNGQEKHVAILHILGDAWEVYTLSRRLYKI
jgi:hypothetical protein